MTWSGLGLGEIYGDEVEPTGDSELPTAELEAVDVSVWDDDPLSIDYIGDSTVIDRITIEKAGAASIPELLQREANVRFESFTGEPSQGAVSMRGFGENSALRVLVIVDGQRINRPDLGGVDWQLIPLDDIASIEVLRGGNNVLYGNFALAGVIQINTRQGGPLRTSLYKEAGSNSTIAGSLYNAGEAGRWFWDTTVSGRSSDGYRDNAENWNWGASATVGRKFGEDHDDTLAFSATVAESFYEFPDGLDYEQFREDPRQSTVIDTGPLAEVNRRETENQSGLLAARWEGNHDWGGSRANASLKYLELDIAFGGALSENDQFAATFDPRFRIGDRDRFVITGSDIALDRIDYTGFFKKVFVGSEADLSRLTVAPFIFAQMPLTEGIRINGGVRYESAIGSYENRDYVETQLEPLIGDPRRGIFVPNPNFKDPPDLDPDLSYDEDVTVSGVAAELSVEWTFVESWTLWAGYDRVYRYPVLDEVASYQGFQVGELRIIELPDGSTEVEFPLQFDPDLEPEVGNQFDLGIRYADGLSWDVSVNAFLLQLDDFIQFNALSRRNENFGSSQQFGANLAASYEAPRWGASTQWEFVDAQFTSGTALVQRSSGPSISIELDGKFIPLVPQAHGVTSLWLKPMSDFEVAVYYTYSTSRWQGNDWNNDNFEGDSQKISAFDRFDLRFTLEQGPATLSFRIDNVLDEEYAPLAFNGKFYPAPGRQFFGGIRFAF